MRTAARVFAAIQHFKGLTHPFPRAGSFSRRLAANWLVPGTGGTVAVYQCTVIGIPVYTGIPVYRYTGNTNLGSSVLRCIVDIRSRSCSFLRFSYFDFAKFRRNVDFFAGLGYVSNLMKNLAKCRCRFLKIGYC